MVNGSIFYVLIFGIFGFHGETDSAKLEIKTESTMLNKGLGTTAEKNIDALLLAYQQKQKGLVGGLSKYKA